MPLPRREIDDSVLLRSAAGELRSTLGETLGAAFSDPLLRPTQMLMENIEQQQIEGPIEDPFTLGGSLVDEDRKPDPDLFVTPEVAAEEFGVDIDEAAPEDVVRLKARRKREQMIRDDVIERGPGGLMPVALRLGVSLAGAATDPINIASAFMPVVSQARFAGLAARHGTFRARALTGAIEGVAGATAVEPLTLSLADDIALDYSMTDALVNVALGGFLGGGLHVAAGPAADALKKRRARLQPEVTETADPETLEGALRASVAQTADGKDVTVDGVFDLTEDMRAVDPGEPFEAQQAMARTEEQASLVRDGYDLKAAREMDEQFELPEEIIESSRTQLEEADGFVRDAENAEPALRAAGECLGR